MPIDERFWRMQETYENKQLSLLFVQRLGVLFLIKPIEMNVYEPQSESS
jgi:hypothetical protein